MPIFCISSKVQSTIHRYYRAESETDALEQWEEDVEDPHEQEIEEEDVLSVQVVHEH